MFGVPCRRFRYPKLCRVVRPEEASLDITRTISILEALGHGVCGNSFPVRALEITEKRSKDITA
jgi:hypothetical protein